MVKKNYSIILAIFCVLLIKTIYGFEENEKNFDYIKISVSVNNSKIKITLKDLSNDKKQIEWSPAVKGIVSLVVTNVKGPKDKDGNIEISIRGEILNIDGEKPVTIDYIKKDLNLKKGYYAVHIEKPDKSDWIVIEIK